MVTTQLLIVDDESSLLEFLGLLFQGEGYRVATASSVAAARERLAGGDGVALVRCTIHIPDAAGLELLREPKEQHSQASVIMMTAYTSTKSAIEAMRLGAYDYVSKPFDVEELKVLVKKALEKSRLVE